MTLTTIDATSKILAFSGDDDENTDDTFKEENDGLEGLENDDEEKEPEEDETEEDETEEDDDDEDE